MPKQERRRYFRINDEVAVSFTLINDEYGGDCTKNSDVDSMDLNQEFYVSLEMQLRHVMVDLRASQPKMAQAIDLINQKVNLLRSDEMTMEFNPVIKTASISACGIAFTWSESFAISQELMLNLYLQPRHELIRTTAHVAAINENNHAPTKQAEPYVIHLDFDDIHSAYQELLIQHIVQRQGSQLRKKLDHEQ